MTVPDTKNAMLTFANIALTFDNFILAKGAVFFCVQVTFSSDFLEINPKTS